MTFLFFVTQPLLVLGTSTWSHTWSQGDIQPISSLQHAVHFCIVDWIMTSTPEPSQLSSRNISLLPMPEIFNDGNQIISGRKQQNMHPSGIELAVFRPNGS